jgi:Response regulator containing CheY-like receiver, AAA-type ATPase, and DNA-binding domains
MNGRDPMTTRILIVDDEPSSRFMARLFLEEAGFVPDEAGSGVEALERCGTVDYDVVVLDHRMPGLSGIDVVRELTESDYPGRLLLFTAYQAPELEAEATRLCVLVVDKARKETLVEHVRELAALAPF